MSLRFLALGDSYTIGEGVTEGERWPVILAQLLEETGTEKIEVSIVAKTGWTTGELLEAMSGLPANSPFSFATICIGVNNQYRGQHVEDFSTDLSSIIQKAISWSSHHVVCLSIPDYSVTPFGRAEERRDIGFEIESFNETAAHVCSKSHVPLVNITALSRMAADDPEMIVSDGLHYSSKMYALWAREVLPYVKAFL